MKLLAQINKAAFAVCIVGLLLNFAACYPGYMTNDSIDQYGQSLSGMYNAWHPPIMAAWWRCLNFIYTGPQSMLAFQLLCFWSAVYLLLDLIKKHRYWYPVVALFAFAPFIQNHIGYVVKDSQMALSWLLAAVWMTHILFRPRKVYGAEAAFCAALLVYGCCVRLNALPGVLPLCFLWSKAFLRSETRIKGLVATGFLLAFCLATPFILNRHILKAQQAYPELKLYMHDLSGYFVATGSNVFPKELYQNPDFDTAYLRKHYQATTFDNIWWNNDGIRILNGDEAQLKKVLQAAWKQLIFTHPAHYLRLRADGLAYYLRVRNSGTHFYYTVDIIAENPWGFKLSNNFIQRIVRQWVHLHGPMPYMRPWFWILLNIVLLFWVRRLKTRAFRLAGSAILLSGLLYFLPLFFLWQADQEFRFTYWNCIVCSIAILLLIGSSILHKKKYTNHHKHYNEHR